MEIQFCMNLVSLDPYLILVSLLIYNPELRTSVRLFDLRTDVPYIENLPESLANTCFIDMAKW